MSSTSQRSVDPHAERLLQCVLWSLFALALLYVLHRALVLRIDYWDSFLYLNNTRRMLGDEAARFTLDKPPILPALYLPVVAIIRHYPGQLVQHLLPHLWAFVLSCLSVILVWRVFRKSLPATLALVGVVLFMGNRVFVHYAAFTLTDVSSVGFTAAVFLVWFVAREQRRWRWFALTGLLIGVAVATRYQNATLPFGIAAAELLLAARTRRMPDRRAMGFLFANVIGVVVWLLAHKWEFEAVGREWSLDSLVGALEYAGSGAMREHPREEWWQYFRMLPTAMSPLVLVLGAIGLIVAAAQRRDHDALFLVWLVILGGGVFRVDHNEIRYLYPAYPPLIYFAMRPLEVIGMSPWVQGLLERRNPALGIAAASSLAMVVAVWPGLHQGVRDQNPFFTSDQFCASATWLAERRTSESVAVWHGRPLTLFPPNPMQFEDDEYFNIFHHYAHIVEFYMGGRLEEWRWTGRDGEAVLRSRPSTALLLAQGTVDDLHSWEVEVVDQPSRPLTVYASFPRLLRALPGGLGDDEGRVLRREGERWVSEIDARAFVGPASGPLSAAQDLHVGQEVELAVDDPNDQTHVRLLIVESATFGVDGYLE